MACLGFLLSCLWEPVQATLLSFLGTAASDCLTFLRDRAVAQVRNLTFFWGNQVELINTPTDHLVGLEEINGYLKKIVDYLKDDAVRIIGIYGMGGVGKTTLLRMLNNDYHKIGAPQSHVLIWVTVSQEDASILKIQKQIGDRFGLSLSADTAGSSSQADEQAKVIFKAFSDSKRRFLLLLDDVWEKLDLVKVGVPYPTKQNDKCIIILTTRSKEVCISMGAKHHLVNVNKLNASESWKLFQEKLGTDVNLDDPCINQLARDVSGKCGGLPLALITVGRAMAEANSVGEWEEALQELKEKPHKFPGMEDEVLSLLKFSFDRLGDETTKQCLLYCCLFPEDRKIPVKEVIDYWVGEGFLDDTESDSILGARNRGQRVITRLKSACLVESAWEEDLNDFYVKMHDVVREMCLWLTGGEFDKNNTFLVYAGSDRVPRSERWRDAKRISLMSNSSQAWPQNIPSCPNLRTLLCKFFYSLYSIPRGFFECMPSLCVLDLSGSRLESLPEEISFLVELRYLNLRSTKIGSLPGGLGKLAKLSQLDLSYCRFESLPEEISFLAELRDLNLQHTKIRSLPEGLGKLAKLSQLDLSESRLESLPEEIRFLAELRYLNLRRTDIESLPRGLGKLAKLSQLDLDYTEKLSHIPREAIRTLTGLRVLGMYDSQYNFDLANESVDTGSCWDRLEELRLSVRTSSSLEMLLKCDRLCLCTTHLHITFGGDTGITAEHLSGALERVGNMRSLVVHGDQKESEVLLDSRNGFGSNLEKLELEFVPKITVVASSTCCFGLLRELKVFHCGGIRDLMWIRQLPRLEQIGIVGCEGMEELLPEVNGGLEERGVDDDAVDCDPASLPALTRLTLCKLPALKSISGRPLLLSSLENIFVYKCPQLKKLPFGSDSAQNITLISGEREWWESLEWHQDADGRSVKARFLPHYVESITD